ncbi:MAG: hypothetical protein R3F36_00690 [Candidatus Competibacteraceae bacterium]
MLKAKARGADVRMVYRINDALEIARAQPDRHVVSFAIGFETTTPPTAVVLRQARVRSGQSRAYCNHVHPAGAAALLATDLSPSLMKRRQRRRG